MIQLKQIAAQGRELAPYAVELRRHFHRHPEPTSREFETVKFICGQLSELGIPYHRIPDGGILAEIKCADWEDASAPHVLLRADCDALTMEESETVAGVPRVCRSENPGVAHMCGHDSHMAMLLGAAKLLSGMDRSQLKGVIYLLFERGEEGGNCIYYVMKYIQEHGIRIDTCFAMHVDPQTEVGTFALKSGPDRAGSVMFEVELIGKGGHGSRPDLANNPIDCFVAIANALKDVRMRHIAPDRIITVNIGSVRSGSKRNIVPESLKFNGTARLFDVETGKLFKERLHSIIEGMAALYGCRAVYQEFSGPSLSVNNDPTATQLARDALTELFGADAVKEADIDMTAESFSTLSTYYPSVMARLGVWDKTRGEAAGLHKPEFDLDERALPYGIAAYAAYALRYLAQHPSFQFTPFRGDADALLRYTDRPVPARYDQPES